METHDIASSCRRRSMALGVELMATFLSSLSKPDNKAVRVAATAAAHSIETKAEVDRDYEKVSVTLLENVWFAKENEQYSSDDKISSPGSSPRTPTFRISKLVTAITSRSPPGSPRTPITPKRAKDGKFRKIQTPTTPTTSDVTSRALERLNETKRAATAVDRVNFICYPCRRRTKPKKKAPHSSISSYNED